jgi:hypothetical protein
LPPDSQTRLRQLAALSAMQSLHLEQVLLATLDRLSLARVEAVLLKGAGLAYTVYDSFADRPMGDLDLLLRAEDAERAWSLLRTEGWTWPEDRWPGEFYFAHQHLPPLIQDQGGVARLEIHRDVLPANEGFRLPVETVWARARSVSVNGRVLLVPDPLHQLLHACVHFAWSHEMRWGTWRTFRDVAALVRKGEFAWPEFVQAARDSNAATCCFWTLRLARSLAGSPVPDHVLAALSPLRSELVLNTLERHYACNVFPGATGSPSVQLSHRLWEAGILPKRSGHGSARPWQVSARWRAGLDQRDAPVGGTRGWGAQGRRLAAWVRYVRRIAWARLPPTPSNA